MNIKSNVLKDNTMRIRNKRKKTLKAMREMETLELLLNNISFDT